VLTSDTGSDRLSPDQLFRVGNHGAPDRVGHQRRASRAIPSLAVALKTAGALRAIPMQTLWGFQNSATGPDLSFYAARY
jgi:hypothetical protein